MPPWAAQAVIMIPVHATRMAMKSRRLKLCFSSGTASRAVLNGSMAFTTKMMLGASSARAATVKSWPKKYAAPASCQMPMLRPDFELTQVPSKRLSPASHAKICTRK